jgi:hypothetical protein
MRLFRFLLVAASGGLQLRLVLVLLELFRL